MQAQNSLYSLFWMFNEALILYPLKCVYHVFHKRLIGGRWVNILETGFHGPDNLHK